MSISHWAASHRRSVLFLIGILSVGGILAAFKLPVALFPRVSFPRVVVSIEAGDQPADQMVIGITRQLEQAVRSVPGVVNIRSTTSRGSAELSINFNWGEDMVAATLQVESVINQSIRRLPGQISYLVRRMDPTTFPVTAYSIKSHTKSQVQLLDIAQYQLVPLLSSIEGVAKVTTLGGEKAEYQIAIDPDKLVAYDLTIGEVEKAISANNVLQAVGRLEDQYKLFLLLSDSQFKKKNDLENTIIRTSQDGIILLRNIAKVEKKTAPNWQRVTSDNQQAVLLQVYQQPGGNTVQIVKTVQQKLAAYSPKLPSDMRISNWYDQSELINESASSVFESIVIGVILAAIVIFIFLRNIKITLIAFFIVPAVLSTAVLLLYLLDMSFNIMTLGGMAAAVGLIVDDAIVMVEHIMRRMHESTGEVSESIRNAANEFTHPLFGSSAATIIIFAPLAFLSGVTGAFFKALSLTMASALCISFLLSWLAVPLLAEHLLRRKDTAVEDEQGPGVILDFYRKLMSRLEKKSWLLLTGLLPFFAIGFFAFKQVGSGFMPAMDEGGFILDYRAPPGTSLTETDRLLNMVENIIAKDPAVSTYSRRTGVQLGGGLTEANEGDFFIRLKGFPRAPIDQVMDRIRQQVNQDVQGIDVEMALLMEDVIGDLTAVPQPVEIKLFGNNADSLLKTAPKVAELISNIDGIVDVNDGLKIAGDAVNIVVDREKATLEGISPELITRELKSWYEGDIVTNIKESLKWVNVRVWTLRSLRENLEQLPEIWLRAEDGHLVPLSRIASVKTQTGQPQIERENLKRMVAVTARISGRDMGSTIADIKRQLQQTEVIPNDIYVEYGGLYHQQQIAFQGLLIVFVSAVVLVLLLLLYLYDSFAMTFSVLSAPILALPAVFIGLWLANIELNITAMMGMTMIVGIVTEISIFYFSELKDLMESGVSLDQALVKAGVNRLRPIAMTTIAAILALLPLALQISRGSAMQQPLAIAIISGLIVQIPLVLVVMPILYRKLIGLIPTR